jgi:DNA-binding NtrC family response regulator
MVATEAPAISSEIPRILVLDDETLVGETLLQMLTHLGYQATLTETEEAALDAWRKAREDHHPFAVAMVDLSLRGEHDGGDVFKRLRKLDPDARAILMSGQLNAPLMHQFQQLGFSAMVAKPFRMEEINRLLRQVIASGAPAESAASAPPGKVL